MAQAFQAMKQRYPNKRANETEITRTCDSL